VPKRKTLEETIKDFKKVHGNKYNYSNVIYKNSNTKVEIICYKHGSFWMTPNKHKLKHGCPNCSKYKVKTLDETILKFKKVHGNKYNYSKVNFINTNTKIEIICSIHGSFWQTPAMHKRGSGCPNCSGKNKTTDDIILDFKKVHLNKYNYSKVEYVSAKKKVEIICSEHGSFWQTPNMHLYGSGCPKCAGKNKTTLDLIKEFKEIHSTKYNYSKVIYKNALGKVEIICPEHGSFFQTVNSHLLGVGCPKCSESKGEQRVRKFLEENNIKYSQEVKLFENYRFDFYLEELNMVIEYDGKQHYESIVYFGGIKGFLRTQARDKIKTEYCLKNNIKLIRIPYWNFKNIEEILKGELCQI
jgi:Zn finger protein HypA/HybF involved in hydrogenase expression